ncbi:PilW family protein [Hylemonella gracilis]|uniref:PilW family protein n=1 Tax=Hylemonella gracilis TaxID=80880 RepID=UPI0013F152A4|nr:PilW family protein [Hylemonella gracilis]
MLDPVSADLVDRVERCQARAHDSERGFTLLELMVALTMGMVVVGAGLAGYVATGRTGRLQATLVDMNESAQIGLTLLARELQQAGYGRPFGLRAVPPGEASATLARTVMDRPIFGCAHGLKDNSHRNQTSPWDASVCAPVVGPRDDVIEVSYEADLFNSSPTSGGLPSDCLGSGLTASAVTLDESTGLSLSYYLTRNRYYLSVGSSGRSELYCASAQGAPGQPLVDNVEGLRLWYGEADAAEPRRVVRYVGAEAVSDWNHVLSVRLCLLMRGGEAVLGEDDALDYQDCDGAPARADDRHPRRAYFSTAALRGRMAW